MPDSVGPDHVARGERLFEQGRYDLAAKELRAATVTNPADPYAPALLALALAACEKGKEALAFGMEAVRRGPEVAFSHAALGYALWMCDRVDDAMLSGREAIRLDALCVDAHLLLAELAECREDWPSALTHARDALFADANETRAAAIVGESLIDLGRIEEAIHALRTCLFQDPEDSELHCVLGRAYLYRGQAAKALPHLREALRLDPNSEAARIGVAEALKSRSGIYGTLLWLFLRFGTRWKIPPAILFLIGWGWFVASAFAAALWKPAMYVMAGGLLLALALIVGYGLSVSLFDLLLLLNRKGRWLLSRKQTTAAGSVAVCLMAAAIGCIAVVQGQKSFLIFVIPTSTLIPWLAGSILRSEDGPNRDLGCRFLLPLIVLADVGVLIAVFASSQSLGEPVIVAGIVLAVAASLLATPFGFVWLIGKEPASDPMTARYFR